MTIQIPIGSGSNLTQVISSFNGKHTSMKINDKAHSDYRADIDGLRAFAVLSVIAFHAFPTLLPGGFVGVDIFFVISGFLISGIMFKSLEKNAFSFTDFYARRVNRIYPALVFVLIICYLFGWFVLFRDEFKQLGTHISRASIFLSNFILWKESGYFDNAAETKPLLHLWSLGIEEQFYILWPLFVWLIWRFRSLRWQLMASVATLSFAWNLYQAENDLVHDFYSPLTRFWELQSGALLAYFMTTGAYRQIKTQCTYKSAKVFSAAGLALLMISIVFISAAGFPGGWAIFPVVGALLIIFGNSNLKALDTILSNRLLVWVGKISYPLYLWHWSIFSFARIIEGETPAVIVRVFGVVLSFLLAWLTYQLLEKPIRFAWGFKYKTITLVVAMFGVGFVGYATYKSDGYPMRSVAQTQNVVHEGDIGHDEFHDLLHKKFYPCADDLILNESLLYNGVPRCFQSKQGKAIDLVLIGDSHAEHLFLGLAEVMANKNVAYYTRSALPLIGQRDFDEIFNSLNRSSTVKDVIIAANWDGKLKKIANLSNFVDDLSKTIGVLRVGGKSIYIMADVPQFDFDPQRCKYKRAFAENTRCTAPLDLHVKTQERYIRAIYGVQHIYPDVNFINPAVWMCSPAGCDMRNNGALLYRDTNHLNINGSRYIASKFAHEFK